jgi:hypothetical protein
MKTYDMQAGEVLMIGDVSVAVLDVDDDRVLIRITENGCTRLETLRVPQGTVETGPARRALPFV